MSNPDFIGPEALERSAGTQLRLRLGANESPFGASQLAIDAAVNELSRSWQYADSESHDLKRAIAESMAIPSNLVAVGNGIDDLLRRAVSLWMDVGSVAVATAGTYPLFGQMVRETGGLLQEVPYRDDFRVDLESLGTVAEEKQARIVYIANPDNPTGSVLKESEVLDFASYLPPVCVLFLDEAYREYACDGVLADSPEWTSSKALRLRTFSKIHGLAGLRVGYAIMPNDGSLLLNRRGPQGVNRIAQAAAHAAILDRHHPKTVLCEVARGREQYATIADALGWNYLPSHTNFVMFDPGGLRTAESWCREFISSGVFVRRGFTRPLDAYIRMTIGTKEERDRLEKVAHEIAERNVS